MVDNESNQSDGLYDEMSQFEPQIEEVDIDDINKGDNVKEKSLEQRMKTSPKLSDFQTADKRLNPQIMIGGELIEWLTNIEMSRVTPEMYIPYRNLIVKHLMREYELSLVEALAITETPLSIAIDGEGRIDVQVLFNRAAQIQVESQNKMMGV